MTKLLENVIKDILKKVRDPEINVNLVDGGLLSGIQIDEEKKRIIIKWIPTTPFCPLVLVISAAIIIALRRNLNLENWDISVKIDESVMTADYWNAQLRDREAMKKIIEQLESSEQIKYFISE